MSRLDQHVAAVQNKLALSRFIEALAWAMLVFAALVTLDIVVARAFHIQFPHPKIWFWSAAGVATLVAMFWSIAKRPTRESAAVAIDEKLGLREKISTALYVRGSNDPFAVAAVKDAEATAGNVVLNYYKHFPLRMPRATAGLCAAIVIALLVGWKFPELDLFGRQAQAKQVANVDLARAQATSAVKQALATVEAVPKSMSDDDAVRKAKIDLSNLLKQPIQDPAAANRSALKALEETREAVKRQAENNSKYAEAQNNMKDLSKNITPPTDEKGPVADAQRKIAEGKFTEAFNQLQQVAEKFDKMDDQQKQKAVQQMQQMAKQLQQSAGNQQQQQQQLAKQLQQQLGVNQQQAQQMAQQMQQAAQGNQQAQQQLQQQAQQMMKQMNNGNGPTPGQQQQMQQAMQQMQAQANSSAAAGQMAQAAQQMAQAMQQASQGQGQQANGQQMAQGMGQMQQQLQNMEATAQDAAQIAAAQQAMNDAVENAQGNCNGQCNNPGGDGGKLQGRKDGAGQWAANNPVGKGAGMGKGGIGAGGRASKETSPDAFKPEMDSSEDNQKGRILASNYIKDNHPIAGKNGEGLKQIASSAEQESSDEVDSDRISNQAKSTVEKYFKTMEDDTK
jgi:chemotaxis protein histidine kinase CheA